MRICKEVIQMKKLIALLIAVLFVLGACSTTGTTTVAPKESPGTQAAEVPTTAEARKDSTTAEETEEAAATEAAATADAESTTAAAEDTPDPGEEKLWSEPGEFPIVDEPMEFTFFSTYYSGTVPMAENEMLKWYEDKTNIIINWQEAAYDNHRTKLALSLASGSYPDAYFAVDMSVAQQLIYGSQGVLIPLNDIIEAEGANIRECYAAYPEIKSACTAPDGNIYALFRYDPSHHMRVQQKMFLNTEWVEQSGLGMPATLDDFTELLRYFRDNDMNGNGDTADEIPLVGSTSEDISIFLMNAFTLYPHATAMSSQTNGLTVEDGQVCAVYATDEYRDGLVYLNSLYEEDLIGSESFTQDNNAMRALINRPDEMIVGAVGTCMYKGFFLSANDFPTGRAAFTAVQPLVGPAGVAQTALTNDGVEVNRNLQITSVCEYPEILIRWIDFWYGEEGAYLSILGNEGVNYEWVDEPAIDGSTPSYKTIPSDPPCSNKLNGQGPFYWLNENRYKETLVPGSSTEELYYDSLMYLEYVDMEQERLPFTVWMDEEQTRLASLLTDTISSYVEEARAQFIIGDLDINSDEVWNNYLETLKNMDLDAYINLFQTVYDSVG